MRKKQVIFFGTFEKKYPRNRLIIDILRKSHNIKIVHYPLWSKIKDKTKLLKNPLLLIKFIFLAIFIYLKLSYQLLTYRHKENIIVTGFIGEFDLTLIVLLKFFVKAKIIANPLVSFYDTIVEDRQLVKGFWAKIIKLWETKIFSICSKILVDTNNNNKYFSKTFAIDPKKLKTVYVSAEENYFYPIINCVKNDKFTILFYGKYIPLHGLDRIVEAIKLVNKDICWKFVGKGQLFDEISSKLLSLCEIGYNIEIIEWVKYEELNVLINKSHLVLGIFGETAKSKRVIPNKVFQSVAAGALVLTQNSPAINEVFDSETMLLCDNSSSDIAEKINNVYENYEKYKNIAKKGYLRYIQKCSNKCIEKELNDLF